MLHFITLLIVVLERCLYTLPLFRRSFEVLVFMNFLYVFRRIVRRVGSRDFKWWMLHSVRFLFRGSEEVGNVDVYIVLPITISQVSSTLPHASTTKVTAVFGACFPKLVSHILFR